MNEFYKFTAAALVGAAAVSGCSKTPQAHHATHRALLSAPATEGLQETGRLEPVTVFNGSMPTGVAVSKRGRIFVSFPRWGDKVEYTVAEVTNGDAVPFPDKATNSGSPTDFHGKFVSVQSVVVDANDTLWVVDTGNVNFGPSVPGAAKIVQYDLETRKVLRSITFPSDVVLPTSYINDIRIDTARGAAGTAYLTDSSKNGANGIIVVDLSSGKSFRRLHDHSSTKAEPGFVANVEGEPFRLAPASDKAEPVRIGSDGIGLSRDGATLYYTPLSGRHLYSVSTDLLATATVSDSMVAASVRDLGDKGFASDGLETTLSGALLLTDYETNAIQVRNLDGRYETVVRDKRLIWPDTLAVASDGSAYVTSSQLNRQPPYNEGKDLRQKPFVLFRVKLPNG